MVVAAAGRRAGELLFNGCRAAWDDEKDLEIGSGNGYRSLRMYFMPLNCTLKNS